MTLAANPDAVLERSADGHLIAITPTGSETGARNNVVDSSSGFLVSLELAGIWAA